MKSAGVASSLLLVLCVCSSCWGIRGFTSEEIDALFEISKGIEDEQVELLQPQDDTIERVFTVIEPSDEDNLEGSVGVVIEELPNKVEVQTASVEYTTDISITDHEKVDNLNSQVKTQQEKIAELEESNKKLLDKLDIIEQQIKTNNLIFANVRESKNENFKITLQKVLYIINKIMRVRVSQDDISVALRGENNSTSKYRPIVVRFNNFATKMKVISARHKLIHSKIDVLGDYSEKVAKIREDLLPYLYAAKAQGLNAYLSYDKLVAGGVKMTLEELQREGDEIIEGMTSTESIPEQDPDEEVEEVEVDPMFRDNEV